MQAVITKDLVVRHHRISDEQKKIVEILGAIRFSPSGDVLGDAEELTMEIFPGISMDPGILFGKPCLTGTRIDVATIVGPLAAGETLESVQDAYAVTRQQILTALRYAAHVAEHVPPAVEQAS